LVDVKKPELAPISEDKEEADLDDSQVEGYGTGELTINNDVKKAKKKVGFAEEEEEEMLKEYL
jgi:hypothetical protein